MFHLRHGQDIKKSREAIPFLSVPVFTITLRHPPLTIFILQIIWRLYYFFVNVRKVSFKIHIISLVSFDMPKAKVALLASFHRIWISTFGLQLLGEIIHWRKVNFNDLSRCLKFCMYGNWINICMNMECYNQGVLSQTLVSLLILVKITELLNIQRQNKRTLGNLRVAHNKY